MSVSEQQKGREIPAFFTPEAPADGALLQGFQNGINGGFRIAE